MAITQYEFTKEASLDRLTKEIQDSTIVTALDHIDLEGSDDLNIYFKDELSEGDETLLNTLVSEHVNEPLEEGRRVVTLSSDADQDNAIIVRPKAAKKGWTYGLVPVEIKTADLDGLYSKLEDGTDRTGITVKFYDSNNDEITDAQYEANIVKTVVDFEPTYDYEVIGGQIQQKAKPETPVRVWVIGVPDVAAQSGGSKEMIGGINLEYIEPSDYIEADGRVSKYMAYNSTYHTNKLRFIFKHNAGVQHSVIIMLEVFRA